MKTMEPTTKNTTQLIYWLPTRALLGLRNVLLTTTKGTAIVNSLLRGYEPMGAPLQQLRNGVLISAEMGQATTYSLKTVEERGTAFIGPPAMQLDAPICAVLIRAVADGAVPFDV